MAKSLVIHCVVSIRIQRQGAVETANARKAQAGTGDWKTALNGLRNMEVMIGVS